MFPFLRNYVLWRIDRKGREAGAPTIEFEEKQVIHNGVEFFVPGKWKWFHGTSAFFLPLPANTWGIVSFPNGSLQNLPGGLREVPPGLYKVFYVDQHERFDVTAPVSEMSLDGEALTLTVIIRYRVLEPLTVLRIEKPIEALIEHVQTDLSQYIRTHKHNDIAESPSAADSGKILSFFVQRHASRHPLSRAIAITGIELKEFAGDKDYIDIRRNDLIQQQRDIINRQQLDRKKEIDKLTAEHKAEIEKINAKAAAEQAALRSEILHESEKRDILLNEMRLKSKQRHELVVKAVDAISQALEHSGYSRNSAEIKNAIADLLSAIREDSGESTQEPSKNDRTRSFHVAGNDKIETLTSTLLSLLKSRK